MAMDNPLTPKKIQKLINLAEGRSFEKFLLTDDELKMIRSAAAGSTNSPRYETSSGILDLEHIEGFGDGGSIGTMSLSRSTTFNPGEMTGRSTVSDNVESSLPLPSQQYGRHSDIDSLIHEMNQQTSEINEIMRHSIAANTNYSFHSRRDLTADEASLIAREAPLPVLQTTHTLFHDTTSVLPNTSSVSVGTYFQNRCVDIQNILGKTDSPDRSMMPSITEVSSTAFYEQKESNAIKIDDTLDSVPVRQPKNNDILKEVPPTVTRTLFKEPRPKHVEKHVEFGSAQASSTLHEKTTLNPMAVAHKAFMTSSKPTDLLLKNLHSSLRIVADDTEGSIENSFSLSKIADYLGNQSNVSVSDMLQLNHQKRQVLKKPPLSEVQMNRQPDTYTQSNIQTDTPVTHLIDCKGTEASSAGSATTVISVQEQKHKSQNKIPQVVITQNINEEDKKATRSKSPISKSPSTLTTVMDNYSSFKSGDSLNSSKGEANRSKVPSPNIAYRELDKSVDWQEVLRNKRGKKHMVEVSTATVEGFVGVSTLATMSVTTLTDNWLSAKFQFDKLPGNNVLNVELPRLPLLLSPGKSENFTFYLTSNVEMDDILPFTFYLKDASLEGDIEQKGQLKVKFKLPVIQAMSSDGLNKLTFPTILENTWTAKSFVLLSDCPADLQIKLIISENDSSFYIKSVQEIKKSDVNKAITERQASEDKLAKGKAKMQLCRLNCGSALRVAIAFDAPKMDDISSPIVTGALNVCLINSDTILKKVSLVGSLGSPQLVIRSQHTTFKLGKEPTEISVLNAGQVAGTWLVKQRGASSSANFAISPNKFTLMPNEARNIQLTYSGPDDQVNEIFIHFEETNTGHSSSDLTLTGGQDLPKTFPIRSNYNSLSWAKAGRKELSLKNSTDKKIYIRCHIIGEGFVVDLPGAEARGTYILSFNPCECRPLPILFCPASNSPQMAMLYLSLDRSTDVSRKIMLFGCNSGEPVRWSGLFTFSSTGALVRCVGRSAIDLRIHNKATSPAFIAATVHFNLQYTQVEPHSRLVGAYKIIPGRSYHTISLRMDWARVEQRAREAGTTALATVTVLTGAETTRRRILKIYRNESRGPLEASLPEHLKLLARQFEGEDNDTDNIFEHFNEPKSALNELTGALRELTAHIDLPSDFAEDNTIIIADETVVEHHTLCD